MWIHGRVILLITLLCATLVSAGEVRLMWDAPITNEDGSPLTDLAGYTVHYGLSSGVYDESIVLGTPTTYTVSDLVVGQTYYFAVTAYDASGNESVYSNEVSAMVPPPPPTPAYVQRVRAGGGDYTDSLGQVWSADKAYREGGWGYVGGTTYSTQAAIANTVDDPLYQRERYGNFRYQFDVPNGTYDVGLRFAEIYHNAPGKRRFDVLMEGQLVLDNYDIYSVAGGKNIAISLVFPGVVVTDGQLRLDFVKVLNEAKLSAVEVISAP